MYLKEKRKYSQLDFAGVMFSPAFLIIRRFFVMAQIIETIVISGINCILPLVRYAFDF